MANTHVQNKPKKIALIGTVWISGALVSLDYTAVSVALPTIAQAFDVGTSLISWASLTYMMVMAVLMLFAGPVIARIGYRHALFTGLGIFTIAGIACALSPTLWFLLAMRALQGLGATLVIVLGPAAIKTLLPKEEHGRAISIYSTGAMTGLFAGPAIGGSLVYIFDWQAIFLLNLPFSAVAFLLTRTIHRDAGVYQAEKAADKIGLPRGFATVFAAALCLSSLIVLLNQGAEWGWTSSAILSLGALTLAAGAGSVYLERRSDSPLLDARFVRARDFGRSLTVLFIIFVQFGGLVFLLPFYFQWLRNLNTDVIGAILASQPVATIATSIFLGFALGRFARRSLCIAGILLLVIGVMIYATASMDSVLALPIAGLLLIGAGAGLYYPSLIELSISHVPDAHAASAASMQASLRVTAQLLGVVIFETIFSGLYPTALNAGRADAATGAQLISMQDAFQATFWCGVACATCALFAAFRLSQNKGKHPDPASSTIRDKNL